jgi:uncharacterized membrane protein YgcG
LALDERLLGGLLTAVAVATFVAAIVTFWLWREATLLWTAIAIEAVCLVGLALLSVWPDADFEAGSVNPELVRCPRCDSVFDPPKRGDTIECPSCGLSGSADQGGPSSGTERAKEAS